MGNACTTASDVPSEADIEEKVTKKLEKQLSKKLEKEHNKTLERANTLTEKARRETLKLKKEKQNFQKLLAEKAGANYSAKTGIYKAQDPDVDLLEYANKSLPEFVFENFAEFSDHVAVIDPDSNRSYSYAKLERLVTRVAAGLADRGFKKGDVLAIMTPNVRELPIIFYAVASLGGIVTTMNPLYKREAVVHQLKDTGAKYIAVTTATLPVAIEAVEEAKSVDELFVFGSDSFSIPHSFQKKVTPFREVKGDKMPTVEINPKTDVVVIPYSSGTSGVAKGVMLTHQNLIANYLQSHSTLDFSSDDVILGLLPMFHVYGLFMFLVAALRNGCTLITMKKKFDLTELLEAMQTHKVTVAHLVPPIILAFAKAPIIEKYNLTSLREIFSGAAPLSHEMAAAAHKRLKCSVRQGYGMTELSPAATIGISGSEKYGSVGRLVPNTLAKIVDLEGKPVGPNERGELWLKGPQVMKGYLNNETETNSTIDKDGFLHTGDVAFCDDQGDFWIVDRVKELIKYKGFQVAPAELEGVLEENPKIAAAGVIGAKDDTAGEIPVAYVEKVKGAELTAEEVIEFVAEKVAGYKKIRKVYFVEQVPKSASGKILRQELAGLVTADKQAAAGEGGEENKEADAKKEEEDAVKKEESAEADAETKKEEVPSAEEPKAEEVEQKSSDDPKPTEEGAVDTEKSSPASEEASPASTDDGDEVEKGEAQGEASS